MSNIFCWKKASIRRSAFCFSINGDPNTYEYKESCKKNRATPSPYFRRMRWLSRCIQDVCALSESSFYSKCGFHSSMICLNGTPAARLPRQAPEYFCFASRPRHFALKTRQNHGLSYFVKKLHSHQFRGVQFH